VTTRVRRSITRSATTPRSWRCSARSTSFSGGIYVKGSLAGSPLSNTLMLAIGAVLANVIGTTGASMVLIRPLLRANETRQRKTHSVVFFIFIVSNCGGLLTPLADPPLFLGFLKGVPFEWTLRFAREWALMNGMLLVIYHFVDSYLINKQERERGGAQLERALKHEPIGIEGKQNLFFLVCIIAVIIGQVRFEWDFGVPQGLMLAIALASWMLTKRATHARNGFTFAPILEVAILFAGIFVTMIAPLAILNARASDLGIELPWALLLGLGWIVGVPRQCADVFDVRGGRVRAGGHRRRRLALPGGVSRGAIDRFARPRGDLMRKP
jgi:Na+/H+ antiporter NhaD/arsenite permease-like protein